MDRESLEKIRKITKDKITVSNFQKDNIMNNKNKINIRKISAVACLCLVLTSGVVFAKDIEKFIRERFYFGLGEGIDRAAEKGYISEPEMEPEVSETKVEVSEYDLGTVIDNINTSVKVNSFLMDDYNLSVEFEFIFDDKIHEYLDMDKIDQITLNDLIVLDEEKRIIFSSSYLGEEKFNTFCNEHELDFKYGEFNENYMNNGLNWFPQNIFKVQNKCGLIYNMYTEGYPKSKELNFYFNEITITELTNENKVQTNRNITLTGDWNIHLDVPEKMYNRTSESYKVVSCENDRFNVYAAKVMDTGFEIGIMISDMIKPEYPKDLREKEREIWDKYAGINYDNDAQTIELARLYASNDYLEKYNDYQFKVHPINVTGLNVWILDEEKVEQILNPDTTKLEYKIPERTDGCYVLNSNGEKFRCTNSPSRKSSNKFVGGNQFEFYETFGMTKYDATDKITVVIEFYGEPIKIELEKNN